MYNGRMTMPAGDLRYPVGRFTAAAPTPDIRHTSIEEIAALPARMRAAVEGLTDPQLDTPYRPGGWTVRQVVHHVADSHMNGYIRAKLALTEDTPTIKPYDEKTWATLADMRLPIAVSLQLLEGLHARWAAVYRAITADQFTLSFLHPEIDGAQTLDRHLQMYAWHSRHHVAHITALRRRQGW
jgi:hypothetical protein